MPQITVIVPLYNTGSCLKRCVDSILQQSFRDFELVLVDDGSTDDSVEICDSYCLLDKRVSVIHKSNGGVASARNSGLDFAFSSNSKWISYIDSDDWVSVDYLETLLSLAKKYNTRCSICGVKYTSGFVDSITGIELGKMAVDDFYKYQNDKENNTCIVSVHDKLYKKDLFNSLRFPDGHIHEDRALSYRLLTQCDYVSVTNKQLYFYCDRDNSIARSDWSPKNMSDICFLDEQYLFFKNNGNYPNAFKNTVIDYFKDTSLFLLDIKNSKKKYRCFYKVIYKKMDILFCLHKDILMETDERLYFLILLLLHPYKTRVVKFIKRYVPRRINK